MSIVHNPKVSELQDRLRAFMRYVVDPGEKRYWDQHAAAPSRWAVPPAMD